MKTGFTSEEYTSYGRAACYGNEHKSGTNKILLYVHPQVRSKVITHALKYNVTSCSSYTHTHTHTHTHVHAHGRTDARTHAHTHTRTRARERNTHTLKRKIKVDR